jgi:hypothetical protein
MENIGDQVLDLLKTNKRNIGKWAGEAGSYWWNRMPDHAERLSRPGLRNKVNAIVGNGMSELANYGSDALLEMGLAAAELGAAPETGGLSVVAHPITKFIANQIKDGLMSAYVDPMLYDIADNHLDLGHRIPMPKGYAGSPLQRTVNQADKFVTDKAGWIVKNHPKNMALEGIAEPVSNALAKGIKAVRPAPARK